jgi:hypothetical protein
MNARVVMVSSTKWHIDFYISYFFAEIKIYSVTTRSPGITVQSNVLILTHFFKIICIPVDEGLFKKSRIKIRLETPSIVYVFHMRSKITVIFGEQLNLDLFRLNCSP